MREVRLRKEITDGYVLLVHFRNPYLYNGGSEKVIRLQTQQMVETRLSVFVLFPFEKSINLFGKKVCIRAWGLTQDEKYIGGFSTREIIKFLEALTRKSSNKGVFIHSLLFSDLTDLRLILARFNSINLYLHDYTTCCTGYTLMKNDIEFCGNAIVSDLKCHDCKYFKTGKELRKNIDGFLRSFNLIIPIAPSFSVKSLWGEAFPKYAKEIRVIPHDILLGEYLENRDLLNEKEAIRIAFVGKGIVAKGYEEWLYAANKVHEDNGDKVELYHFGSANHYPDFIQLVEVSILKDGLDGMLKKLREYRIHAVVLFSKCPETYSLTYFESLCANAFVITSSSSGNIANEVQKRGNGKVLVNSQEALADYICNLGELRNDINVFRSSNPSAPQMMVANPDYLKLLQDNIVNEQEIEKRSISLSTARLADLLYRIRYRKYI